LDSLDDKQALLKLQSAWLALDEARRRLGELPGFDEEGDRILTAARTLLEHLAAAVLNRIKQRET